MLDVRRMRVLREVAVRGSFSAAAEALSYTQSAVSQQIAALERETGTTLVQRSARGIRLTEAGEALVRHADAVIARLADAEAELDAIAGLRGGRLRLASFSTAGATLLPAAIATFRQRHPGIELSLAEAEPEESVPRLKAGDLELALIFEPNGLLEGTGGGIDYTHLLDDPFLVALARRHPLAGRARLRLADLAGEAWVCPTDGCACSRLVLTACRTSGFEPHVSFESDDYLAIQGLVAAGVGVALIPMLGLATVRDDIVVRPLRGQRLVRQVVAATPPSGLRSPATAAMLEILGEQASRYGSPGVRETPGTPVSLPGGAAVGAT
jgi:DNA-binding transcriptional LysR family regulator